MSDNRRIPSQRAAGSIRVVLVEDHPMYRESLANVIENVGGMNVCGEAATTVQALEVIRSSSPDVVLADISLRGSDGLDLIKDLKAAGLDAPVLVLSMHEESLYAERSLRAGARGYLTKYASACEVLDAISLVVAGGMVFSSEMTHRIIMKSINHSEPADNTGVESLTNRELEIFRKLGEGCNVGDLAVTLGLAESTIHTYCGRIREKLGVRDSPSLYLCASRWRLEQGM